MRPPYAPWLREHDKAQEYSDVLFEDKIILYFIDVYRFH